MDVVLLPFAHTAPTLCYGAACPAHGVGFSLAFFTAYRRNDIFPHPPLRLSG